MSTIAIVQCRLGSQRFPRKALADLNGRPVIAHVVERALKIRGVDRVIVATPSLSESAEIFAVLPDDSRLTVFSSRLVDETDVLGRFVAALENYPECDTVMRLTADSPVIQPDISERVLALYRETDGCDYAWNRTTDHDGGLWPDGLNAEVFSRRILDVANLTGGSHGYTERVREHVTPAIRTHPQAHVQELPFDPAYAGWPKCSIDTPEDLERVREWMQVTA